MPGIEFNEVPTNIHTPFIFIEFGQRENTDLVSTELNVLLIGQKTREGTQPNNQPIEVLSANHASRLFGEGSHLHLMCEKYLQNNPFKTVDALVVEESSISTKTVQTITITLPNGSEAPASGVIHLYIGSRSIPINVIEGDSRADIARRIHETLENTLDLPVESAHGAGNVDHTVILTALNTGSIGNTILVHTNYGDNQETPEGVNVAITHTANSGAGQGIHVNALSTALAAIGDSDYNLIVSGYNSAVGDESLDIMRTFLRDRFVATSMLDGVHLTCLDGFSVAGNPTLDTIRNVGRGRNDRHLLAFENRGTINSRIEVAAALAGAIAREGSKDPARPFQTLELKGIYPNKGTNYLNFTRAERDVLLQNGVATMTSINKVRIERAITTYRTDADGRPDDTWEDVNSFLTASFIRRDFVNLIKTKYPRHKLGNDGQNYDPDQPVMTPNLMKTEWLGRYQEWQENALVDNYDEIKSMIQVVRNANNRNRLDIELNGELIGQFRILAGKILL